MAEARAPRRAPDLQPRNLAWHFDSSSTLRDAIQRIGELRNYHLDGQRDAAARLAAGEDEPFGRGYHQGALSALRLLGQTIAEELRDDTHLGPVEWSWIADCLDPGDAYLVRWDEHGNVIAECKHQWVEETVKYGLKALVCADCGASKWLEEGRQP